MKNKLLKTIALLTTGAVLLAGCGSSSTTTQEASDSSADTAAVEETTIETVAETTETTVAVEEAEVSTTASEEADEISALIPDEDVELTILAAASLTDVCDELKARFEAAYPNVTLSISYGGSGALQTQIEEGAPADVFMSAAQKQMTALDEEGLMDSDTIINLLENKVVLIVPKGSDTSITSFEDLATDAVEMVGLGEPGSVPVGQYSEEIFESLGILDEVTAKANYGSDVRTVLSWVETSAVDCGVVYATDAYTTDEVEIICEAPEGSCQQVIYPVGVVASSEYPDVAAAWLAFIQTEESMELFASYGFSDAR